MSCCFNPTSQTHAKALLPDRHVNHVQGMVLGVDEFRQVFAYLDGRDRWLARDLLGYGTVRGLHVTCEPKPGAAAGQLDQWVVKVKPGAALDPCGHLVCVREEQCGHLNRWLAEHGEAVSKARKAQPAQPLTLHLVLRYLDCATDSLPIPGTPCRSEDQLKVPTRVADDFEIDFHLDPPAGSEDIALRAFHAWLASIPVLPWRKSPTALAKFEQEVSEWTPTMALPPKATLGALDAAEYLRQALRLWTTELRPKHFGRACTCVPAAQAQTDGKLDGVLLATLTVDIEQANGQTWQVKDTPTASQTERPVLLPTHMLTNAATLSLAAAAAGGSGWGQAGAVVPPVLGRFVAAAQIQASAVAEPNFGGVRLKDIAAGRMVLTFNGYTKPDAKHQYIVKVMPIGLAVGNPTAAPTVALEAFDANAFTLAVWVGAATATKAEIAAMALMVEVSELKATAA